MKPWPTLTALCATARALNSILLKTTKRFPLNLFFSNLKWIFYQIFFSAPIKRLARRLLDFLSSSDVWVWFTDDDMFVATNRFVTYSWRCKNRDNERSEEHRIFIVIQTYEETKTRYFFLCKCSLYFSFERLYRKQHNVLWLVSILFYISRDRFSQ